MTTYIAPVREMLFAMNALAGLEEIAGLPGNEEISPDLVEAILDEAGKFATEVLAPINAPGDRQGNTWRDGEVSTADGFKEAYASFCETGWNGMPASTEFGGQGLPVTVSTAVLEMWKSANMSFSLCQMLTLGAVEAIAHHGSDELKNTFLPNMVAGTWTGTMNLTEPQAGSDLAAVRCKAEPRGDGSYAISGTKIFITWGEHDMAENIIHLVLARLPDAPPGVKGISLFVAPKFLVNADGSLGARNDLVCASIEHKMGIHASATAVMAFGEKDGAIGYLVGEPNRGLEYMFTMMNHARLNVGLEGVGIAERAYQQAVGYARDRIQGRIIGDKSGDKKPILHHPDVRRMLMDMKSRTEATRAIAYYVAGCMDRAKSHPDETVRGANQRRLELLTPVVKGWCTEAAQGVTWNGIQVHGGMGFIEETGACQHMRDARITTIYEGTTAIQANDLIGRKVAREGGHAMRALLEDMATTRRQLDGHGDAQMRHIGAALGGGMYALAEATDWLLANYDAHPQAAAAGAVPFLKLAGTVAGGWLMARSALVAFERLADSDDGFYAAKLITARYFSEHVLPEANSYRDAIVNGSESVLAMHEALF
ncbi:acyl-CoA dehydrogenase [Denitromonas ohlonensis]|uniref:3-methylmercaptopropionyl-CoA dehydrogenase n=2 Tax=Denitromonas TaxID=139331 RepID=A0A557RVX1_9RHOO|nr:acyl-CoA dehydrogenase [Denitromonas ohlonensis]MCZ4305260.1 acyl-CoA dehydrogenase [Zoogloeaceae bacterium G21618-S1]TVO69298.1 acyl-CoA dehydrogenase [Denitromonas ohlonensis]TVO77398.1 acyl-CoA dehydrogenase [Denitromonas ohlonensis]